LYFSKSNVTFGPRIFVTSYSAWVLSNVVEVLIGRYAEYKAPVYEMPMVVMIIKTPKPIRVFRCEKVGLSSGSSRYALTYVQSNVRGNRLSPVNPPNS
jgi:hypothetical protein